MTDAVLNLFAILLYQEIFVKKTNDKEKDFNYGPTND